MTIPNRLSVTRPPLVNNLSATEQYDSAVQRKTAVTDY